MLMSSTPAADETTGRPVLSRCCSTASSESRSVPPLKSVRHAYTYCWRRRDEIPQAHQATVLTLYRIWLFLALVLVINLVGAILLLVSGASNGISGPSLVTLSLDYADVFRRQISVPPLCTCR